MSIPKLNGLHHLKFPVSSLDGGVSWFSRIFGAERLHRFDHFDGSGKLFAVVLAIPTLGTLVELMEAPKTAAVVTGYDPVNFAVDDRARLEEWAQHLDRLGIEHTAIEQAAFGQRLKVSMPDGLAIGFYTKPAAEAKN